MKGKMIRKNLKGDYQVNWGDTILTVFLKNIFSSKMKTKIESTEHSIQPDNMWMKKFSIFQSDDKIGCIEYGWKGTSTIDFNDQKYFIRPRGFWKNYLEVRNEQNDVIMHVRSKFNWSKFQFEYELLPTETDKPNEFSMPLVFVISYCVYISIHYYLNF